MSTQRAAGSDALPAPDVSLPSKPERLAARLTATIHRLRQAVARLYNDMHRKGKPSQYTWENVCIVPGGRAGLIRIAAVLGESYLSFFVPDYSAYSEMLSLFKNVSVVPCCGLVQNR